ncbi:hypothetical protein ADL15_40365 [Actinoplanes awajinensis subsp. mycoplanecinus]|uniref:IPT/TIG domain-containing protein n=1 Tax=Actinoplanes awajinensis subsp. mycoplanecinus TaxID=135947 RepID=A0A117MMJ1_9ACTN|nr:hypothetical protein ADL15_40365 [Actinoplanes awajinensis subsp. mycoplanecinus]
MLAASQREHYVGLHIEQGVPLLDRDVNLLQDLLASALQAVLHDYVGDGTHLLGDEAFRILPIPEDDTDDMDGAPQADADNDFLISDGDRVPGSFLAGGLRPVIKESTRYSAQLPEPPPLTSPRRASRRDLVYLDAWLDEVTAAQDGSLFNDDVGMQTSVRQRCAWTVQVVEGAEAEDDAEAQEPALPAAPAGHVHTRLAVLRRRPQAPRITEIDDLRLTGLNLGDLLRRLRLGFSPGFTAAGYQVRPSVGVPGTALIVSGRNLETANAAFLTPVDTGLGGYADVSIGGRPGEVVVTVPDGTWGDCVISVGNDYGAATTDDPVTVLRCEALPVPGDDDYRKVCPVAVNNRHQVVGNSVVGEVTRRPLLWEKNGEEWEVTILRDVDGANPGSTVVALDDAGHAIGASAGRAVVWDLGTGAAQATLTADVLECTATVITPDGRFIAGYGAYEGEESAVLWRRQRDKEDWEYIGSLSHGDTSGPATVRPQAAAAGFIAGSVTDDQGTRAVIWYFFDEWRFQDVFPDPQRRPSSSWATAVNDAGVVAGAFTKDDETFLFAWDANTGEFLMTESCLLMSEPGVEPRGITASGHVLANLQPARPATSPPGYPVLWSRRDGQVLLVAPTIFAEAYATSDSGEVVGRSFEQGEAIVWTKP